MATCVDNFVMTICDFINFHLNTKNNIIFEGDRHQSKNHCQSIEGNETTKTSSVTENAEHVFIEKRLLLDVVTKVAKMVII